MRLFAAALMALTIVGPALAQDQNPDKGLSKDQGQEQTRDEARDEEKQTTVADLAWLAGSWIEADGDTTTREVWLAPLDGAMSGVGQTTRTARPPVFEFMTITSGPDGPTFTAYLKGQEPTAFVLKLAEPGAIVFENPQHDFPRWVIYRQCGDDLCARIDGTLNGEPKAIDWRYKRATP